MQITAAGLTNSYSFYLSGEPGAGVSTRITGSTVAAQSGSNINIGISWDGGGGGDLFLEQSQVRGSDGATSRGIDLVNGALTVDHSEISGTTHSFRALVVDPVRVGASRLAGPRSLGVSAQCAASYDGTFTALVCP